jgi:hypothetical protein
MQTPPTRSKAPLGHHGLLWTVMALWLFAVLAAVWTGALAHLAEVFMPGYAVLVALGITLPVIAYMFWKPWRQAVEAMGLHRLTLLHIWRIPAGAVFFYYGLSGELPTLFWTLAGVGDVLAGLFAASLLWRPQTLANYKRIHIFGLIDFVIAVGTGLTFTLLEDPRMAVLTTLPMALIPLYGVGLSGASHLVVLSWLRRSSGTAAISAAEGIPAVGTAAQAP